MDGDNDDLNDMYEETEEDNEEEEEEDILEEGDEGFEGGADEGDNTDAFGVETAEEGLEALEDEDNIRETVINYKDYRSKGTSVLTHFERTRLVGFRAIMLSDGAQPLLPDDKVRELWNKGGFIAIAQEEIRRRIVPLISQRKNPTSKRRVAWNLASLADK